MSNLRSDNRIEIKYLSDEKSSHKILQQINSSKYQFKLHHPDRLVNSIYFDTPQTKELTNSVEGNFKKRKFRFRFYGSEVNNEEIAGQWEVKEKIGNLTNKLTYFETVSIDWLNSDNLISFLSSHDEVNFMKNIYPIKSNSISYMRNYFISDIYKEEFRLTIDSETDPILPMLRKRKVNSNRRYKIIEIKISKNLYDTVKFQNIFELPRVGFSKYVET